jgi:alpha-tubulin suppressor-like RCC1 family protein
MRSSPIQVGTGFYRTLSLGNNSTMAIDPYGTLSAWGENLYGQAGTNSITTYSWTQLRNGDAHSLALRSDGTLYAWGFNGQGQLGVGNTIARQSPTQVSGSWASVSAGSSHTLGIKSDNTLWGWGTNGSGSVGDGTIISRSSPVQIDTSAWTSINAGLNFSLAIKTIDKSLWTWGVNTSYQLGTGTTTPRSLPSQVGISSWTLISAGATHALATDINNKLYGWGTQTSGQLGLGDTALRSQPTQIGASSWAVINAGYSHSIALTSDNRLFTWGINTNGQLGFNMSFTSISAGNTITSVIRSDGTLWTWGFGTSGQLGDNTAATKSSPVAVGLLTNWSKTTRPSFTNYAIDTTNKLYAWGENSVGAIGDSTTVNKSSPVQIGNSSWTMVATTIGGVAGQQTAYAIRSDGGLFAWGDNSYGQANSVNSLPLSSPTQIGSSSWSIVSAGLQFAMAITTDGKLFGWGRNDIGQLGITASTFSWTKVNSSGLHTLAVRSDNRLFAWGLNTSGQLGLGDTVARSSPVQISSGSYTQISAGLSNSYAIRSDGSLFAWGDNSQGQISLVSQARSSPVQIGAGSVYSVYFNGTTDFLSLPTTVFSSIDGVNTSYTLECWIYPTVAADGLIMAIDQSGQTSGTFFYMASTRAFGITNAGANNYTPVLSSAGVVPLNAWSHLCLSKSGSTAYLFFNGILQTTVTVTAATMPTFTNTTIGARFTSGIGVQTALTGYLSNLRLVVGTAVYTPGSPPGPPTSSLSNITNTKLLVCQSSTIVDNSSNNFLITSVGLPKIDYLTVPFTQSNTFDSWSLVSASQTLNYILATRSDSTLYGWGNNVNGVIGSYSLQSLSNPVVQSPTQVSGGGSWIAISAGGGHSLAIKSDYKLYVWGNNTIGQTAQAGTTFSWTQIAAGLNHSVAIRSDGILFAWGQNNGGQLGLSDTVYRSSPVQLGSSSWSQISAGSSHTIAIRSDSTLWAWGYNNVGQVGLGDTSNRSSPVQIGSVNTWSKVSAGSSQSFAIRSDASLYAWGLNVSFGELGDGTVINKSSPVQVGSPTSWTQIAVGSSFTGGIDTLGRLYTWGYNLQGQLGSGVTAYRSAPVQVTGNSWNFIAAGQNAMAGIDTLGKLYTWGNNAQGEFGDNSATTVTRSSPVILSGTSSWSSVTAGTQTVFAITTANALWAWGVGTSGTLGDNTIVSKSSAVAVAGGATYVKAYPSQHALAITTTTFSLQAWGFNTSGQLGDSTVVTKSSPIAVGTSIPTILSAPAIIGNSSWTTVSAGGSHSTAVRTDGGLFTWGLNSNGQLGLSDTVNRSSPVQVGTSSWTVVSSGASHTVALKYPDNSLFTWGFNTSGQLGNGVLTARSSPVQVGTPVTTGYTTLYTSTSTYLTFPGITVGTNAYTAELWFYLTDGTFPAQRGLIGPSTRVNNAFNLRLNTATTINVDSYVSSAQTFTVPTMLANTWYHFVAVRNASNVTTVFLNGVRSSTGAVTLSNNYSGAFNQLGGILDAGPIFLPGYISNFRMVIGTAVYDPTLTTLTVPTAPLTAVAGTVLLTSQNATLIDNSTNNSTITNNGGVSITPFSPFAGSGLYSALVAGANYSVALDTGNNLYTWGLGTSGQIGDSTAVTKSLVTKIGTLIATVEYSPVQVGNDSWSQVSAGASHTVGIKLDNTVYAWGLNSSGQLGDNTVVSRSSPVQVGTISSTLTNANAYSLRFNGTSQYLTTSAQTSSTYFGTGDFTIETWVNLTSTPTKVSGGTFSLPFDGTTGQYLVTSALNSSSYLGSGDFTIEAWIYLSSTPAQNATIICGGSLLTDWQISWATNGFGFLPDGSTRLVNTQGIAAISNSTWYHVAFTKASGTMYSFLDGTRIATGASETGNYTGTVGMQIGANRGNNVGFPGYISNLRIVKGQSLFSGSFTPATSPLTNSTIGHTGANVAGSLTGAVILLTGQNATIVDNSSSAFTFTNNGSVSPSSTSVPQTIYDYASLISVNNNWQWGWNDSGSYGFNFMLGLGKTTDVNTGVLSMGVWYHIAVQRRSGILSAWVNGVNTGSNFTDTTNYTSTNAIYIGRNRHPSARAYFPGYISNLRIIKGQGLFTGTFTPAGSPLTTTTVGHTGSGVAVSFTGTTVLLTAQNTSIVDNSTTAFTFTNTGSIAYSLGTPFTSAIATGALFAIQVSAGGTHSVAIDTQNKLYAWGTGGGGVLGLNDSTNRSAPVQVGLATNWNNISAGNDHTIALDSVGTLYAWGLGTTGQLGDLTALTKSSPVLITAISLPNTSSPTQVGTSSYSFVCTGNNTTAAISSENKLFVWGLGTTGQLGTSITISRSSPTQISTNSYNLVNAGGTHTTFVSNVSPQLILATGLNTSGQLGLSDAISRSSPTQVAASTSSFNSPVTVSTGDYSSYYVSSPTQVGTSSWTSVSAGGTHTLAIRNNNTLWAWGYNANGQLGGSNTINRSSPVQVGTSSWSQVSAGDSHNIILKSDGTINTFGLNTFGQLGDGT